MANQVKTILCGFSYQHIYSFCELVRLLDAESAYDRGRVEDPEAAHTDDVTLYPRPGAAAPARFIQVKWHTDLRDDYSFESLCQRSSGAATSLLQKLYKSWQTLRVNGEDLELWLVSTWPADKKLGKHIGNARLTDALFAAHPGSSDAGRAFRAWAAHLGCSDEELGTFARCLRFRLGLGDDLLEFVFDALMQAHGLRTGIHAMQAVEAMVGQWVKDGPIEIQAEMLRQAIAERGLEVGHGKEPRVCLWIHGWARRTYAQPATMEIDWTAYCDREARRIPTSEEWQAVIEPQLANARALCERAQEGFVDVRGLLPLTVALATGAALPAVAGYRLRCEQFTEGRMALWRSDVTPSSLTWHTEVLQDRAAGQDSLVVLAITGDARVDIERFVAAADAGDVAFGRVILATPNRGTDDNALRDDADAVALANEARKLIKQERQNHGARRIHLILYAPAGFALFLGQRLNALGTIVTYEATRDGGYQASVVLHTT